jgi:hypothetical protein
VCVLETRPGLQRVEVDLGTGPERAYALTQLTGDVAVGDRVVVNTTAVELGLGTGGWHVVHWNLARDSWQEPGPGHILKARYTSLQTDVGSTEEQHRELVDVQSIDGLPVVVVGLHSQLAAVAVACKAAEPALRLAYVMTDGAALPIALSDLVHHLRGSGLLDATITADQAFGGEYEAVTLPSALAIAKHVVGADIAVVGMGPGIVGTGTRLGCTGLEVAAALDTAVALGGLPIAALRASFADPRPRHRGISHHSRTALGVLSRERVTVALPTIGGAHEQTLRDELAESGIAERHAVVDVEPTGVVALFETHGLHVTSMGRPAAEDPVLFEAAAVAGVLAVRGAASP